MEYGKYAFDEVSPWSRAAAQRARLGRPDAARRRGGAPATR